MAMNLYTGALPDRDEDFLVIVLVEMSWNYLAVKTNLWCNRSSLTLQQLNLIVKMAILGTYFPTRRSLKITERQLP